MREKIIDTAIEEFTRNGLKFTMNDVAKALGISKKTIYTVFESKQDVLMAIADRYARDFTDMRQEIEADTELDTLEKLERLFCAIPTAQSDPPPSLWRIYFESDILTGKYHPFFHRIAT